MLSRLSLRKPSSRVALEPRVEGAGNLLARTFVDAHAADWCEAFADGAVEASLPALRASVEGAPNAAREAVACEICTQFAGWHLWPSTALDYLPDDAPVCERLAGPSASTVRASSAQDLVASAPDVFIEPVVVSSGSLADL